MMVFRLCFNNEWLKLDYALRLDLCDALRQLPDAKLDSCRGNKGALAHMAITRSSSTLETATHADTANATKFWVRLLVRVAPLDP